jgi:hypothetical protein
MFSSAFIMDENNYTCQAKRMCKTGILSGVTSDGQVFSTRKCLTFLEIPN